MNDKNMQLELQVQSIKQSHIIIRMCTYNVNNVCKKGKFINVSIH